MKKTMSLVTAFLFSFCVLHAQQKPSKYFVEIAGGASFPIGQFAEKKYAGLEERDQPGMASVGAAANITGGYHIKENVGVLLTVGYSINKQKVEKLEEYIRRYYFTGATEADVIANEWKVLKVMAGGFFVTPLSEGKLNLITKLSAGICKTAVPAYKYWAFRQTGPPFAGGSENEIRLPKSFCYQISLGLQYKINERFHLLFDINSFNSTATHHTPRPGDVPAWWPDVPDRKFKFGSINTLLGVGVSF